MNRKSLLMVLGGLLCVAAIAAIFMIADGTIVFDHSALVTAETLEWKGNTYVPISGKYEEGRRLARSADGWSVMEVEGDPAHRFLAARSFMDERLYVLSGFEPEATGDITLLWWGGQRFANEELSRAILALWEESAEAEASVSFEVHHLFSTTGTVKLKEVYVARGDCSVATESLGYLGTVNGQWVLVTEKP